MLSIQQHKVMNAQYANETSETAVVQIARKDGGWSDYSRCTLNQARYFIGQQINTSNWRVVDWITKEEINLNDEPEPEADVVKDIEALMMPDPWGQKTHLILLRKDEGDGAGHKTPPFNLRRKLLALEGTAMAARDALANEHEGDLKLDVEVIVRLAAEIDEFVRNM